MTMTENTQDKITDDLIEDVTKKDEQEKSSSEKKEKPPIKVNKKLTPMEAGGKIMGIIPQNYDQAWRAVEAMYMAGMCPNSYEVFTEVPAQNGGTIKQLDANATKGRMMIGLLKGLEIGIPPITAFGTICIINNKACLWGDGAVALVQSSRKVDWIKSYYEGDDDTKEDFTAHYIVKRKDQDEPYHRTFSRGDAKRANLLSKKGPWAYGYATRMLMMRAQAWALRDGFSDVLMGVGIAEEVRDFENVEKKREDTDLSSLDDDFTNPKTEQPAALENKTDEAVYMGIDLAKKGSDQTVEMKAPAQGTLLSNSDITNEIEKDENND